MRKMAESAEAGSARQRPVYVHDITEPRLTEQ